MNIAHASAFILHQRPYRETSLLLDVFSEQYGRSSLVAKGVRNKKRNQSGALQVYQPLLLSWIGRGALQTLTHVETAEPRYILKAESALCGLYLNELLVRLLPLHEAEPGIFKAYQQALLGLQQEENTEVVLRLFEKRLLSHLGYGLVLNSEVENGLPIEGEQRYYYQPDSGLYRWQSHLKCGSISGRSLQHLLNESDFDQQSLQEIKQLMRTVIHYYLDGKPLKSRQLFAELKQYS